MKKMLKALSLVFVLTLAGCSCDSDFEAMSEEQQDQVVARFANTNVPAREPVKVDPSIASCGEFPRGTDDGSVQSRYAVCKNATTGDCYIKTLYPRPKQGCDPEFGKYRMGNPVCFDYVSDIHEFEGDKVESSVMAYRPGDTCELTTPEFFRTVMEARK